MELEYILKLLNIGEEKRYYGQPEYRNSWNQEDVINEMMRRNAGLSRQAIEAVLSLLNEVVLSKLKEGYRVNLDLVNLALVIKGTFAHEQARFEKDQHQVKMQANEGKAATRALNDYVPKRSKKTTNRAPKLEVYTDLFTKNKELLTPGAIGTVTGFYLKYSPDDPEQGLFLVDAHEQYYRVTQVAENQPRKITFQVPKTLPAGTYHFEIKNRLYVRGKYHTHRMARPVVVTAQTTAAPQ